MTEPQTSLPKGLDRQSRGPSPALRTLADVLFVLPAVLLVGGLLLLPIASGIFWSFFDWSPGYESPFVGFANYIELLQDPVFLEILRNEAFFLIGVPIWLFLPLVIALVLYEKVPFAGLFRTLIFFPAIASPAILGIFFRGLLAPTGILNETLDAVGLGAFAQNWLADPLLVKPVLIMVLTWAGAGVGVLIFSAALSSVDPSLFEAAEIEGASFGQKLRYVVFPALRPIVDLYLAMQILITFSGMFPWIYVLTAGGPGYASTTLDYDVYLNALTFGDFGLAAAEAVYLMLIIVLIVVLTQRLRRRRSR